MDNKRIHSALISVFNKDGLEQIARKLKELEIVIYSTGGTKEFIEDLDIPVVSVETITEYPAILGGRVKTLHPKVFGGILAIRNEDHLSQLAHFRIPLIDLVVVDLYPFEETLKLTDQHDEIIEKIDIGGISLIRAAAKNYRDVVVIPSKSDYGGLMEILSNNAISTIDERKKFAANAFQISQSYDQCIHSYLSPLEEKQIIELRYGENPHQKARFIGNLNENLEVLSGKDLSYNNILDIDSALNLMTDFRKLQACFAVLKHTNVCGLALRENLKDAWIAALAGDPVSAFGGILICNRNINLETAQEIHPLFYEVLLAPGFDKEAMELLQSKKNRILIKIKQWPEQVKLVKTAINGLLEQDVNKHHAMAEDLEWVSTEKIDSDKTEDLLFAIHCVKHLKSNAIAIVKGRQLIGMGCGQTSRVDALKQAISKAKAMGFKTEDSVMASEAFFPFPDCVELAGEAGIIAIAQPGGSVNDAKSIDKANELGIAMAFTGIRHFKH